MTARTPAPTGRPPASSPPRRRASEVGAPEIVDVRRVRVRVVLVLLAVVAAMGLALWGFTDTLSQPRRIDLPRIAVPSVEHLTIDEARAELEDLGFTVTVLWRPNENKPKGAVLGQRPLAGSKALQGDLVTILASDGPLGWTVPSMVGQQLSDALVSLIGAPVRIETVDTFDEQVPVGEVIATVPPPGSRIGPEALLRIMVSVGPEPRVVPDVIGQPLEQALVEIGRAGLMIGDVTEAHRPELQPNSVVELGDDPGSEVPRETPIDIVIAVPEDLRTVPYLTGLRRESAVEMLRSVGLEPQIVTVYVPAGDATAGRVTSQGTAPQAKIPRGTPVTITVAVAEAPVIDPPAGDGG